MSERFLLPEDWSMIENEPLLVHTLDAEAVVNTLLALKEHGVERILDLGLVQIGWRYSGGDTNPLGVHEHPHHVSEWPEVARFHQDCTPVYQQGLVGESDARAKGADRG